MTDLSFDELINEMRTKVRTEDVTLLCMSVILYLDMMLPGSLEGIAEMCDFISEKTGLGLPEGVVGDGTVDV